MGNNELILNYIERYIKVTSGYQREMKTFIENKSIADINSIKCRLVGLIPDDIIPEITTGILKECLLILRPYKDNENIKNFIKLTKDEILTYHELFLSYYYYLLNPKKDDIFTKFEEIAWGLIQTFMTEQQNYFYSLEFCKSSETERYDKLRDYENNLFNKMWNYYNQKHLGSKLVEHSPGFGQRYIVPELAMPFLKEQINKGTDISWVYDMEKLKNDLKLILNDITKDINVKGYKKLSYKRDGNILWLEYGQIDIRNINKYLTVSALDKYFSKNPCDTKEEISAKVFSYVQSKYNEIYHNRLISDNEYSILSKQVKNDYPVHYNDFIKARNISKNTQDLVAQAQTKNNEADLIREKELLTNQLEVANTQVKRLTQRAKYSKIDYSRFTYSQVSEIAGKTKKKNGKLNYSQIATKLGLLNHHTARRLCDYHKIKE